MFTSPLFRGLLDRVTPTPLVKFLTSGDDDSSMSARMLPELLDRTIDHLCDDKRTLLALGLVSKQTLARSRRYLFSTVEFNDNDGHFDAFLTLLDAPWTSFTSAVQSLHVKDLFHVTRGYTYPAKTNIPRIVANLTHLKTLRVASVSWLCIPPHIRDFFFQLNTADLELDSVEFYENELVELFSILPPSLETLSLYNLQYDDIHDLSGKSSIFQRRFRFKSLDTSSLVLLKDVWDPAVTKTLDITVESFHLRLLALMSRERDLYTPFISRFLQRAGPSLHSLFIILSEPFSDPRQGKLSYSPTKTNII